MKPVFARFAVLSSCLAMLLASCDKNPVLVAFFSDGKEDETVIPTEDQMEVSVAADYPAAVLSQFPDGSTGAALLKRLPGFSTSVGRNTKLVVIKGSDVREEAPLLSGEQLTQIARIYLDGGCIALETPTLAQIQTLMGALQDAVTDLKQEEWLYKYGLDPSWLEERDQTRLANIRSCSTRAGVDDADAVAAEMVILGPTEYFYQEPFDSTPMVATYAVAGNGQRLLGSTLESSVEKTEYDSGVMADAAASWINGLGLLRAGQPLSSDGAGIINSLMNASETFTHYNTYLYRTSTNVANYAGNIVTTFRSWGVHNFAENRDFYYIRQSVLLQSADLISRVRDYDENTWQIASGYGDYDRWYGSFLSRYETSLGLSGSGSIRLEEALPYTDNTNSTVSITCGQSSSSTETLGCSWSVNAGGSPSGPSAGINWGGNYSLGHTEGTSFSMGFAKSYNDLSVKKNTDGTCVSWTYEGHLPQYREEYRDGHIYYCHEKPANILVNDANLDNEICWSVSNPSGVFTLDVTAVPETAALLFARGGDPGNKPHKYEYTTNPEEREFHYQLLQPNRSLQNWRMYVTIDEWEGTPVPGALGYLEQNLVNAFPVEFRQIFTVADKTAGSLQVITANIAHAKEVFTASSDILLGYAQSWGIKQYTIHWRCDDTQHVTLQDSYVVAPVLHTPYKLHAVRGSSTLASESFDKALDDNFNTKWKVDHADRDTKENAWVLEFTSEEPVLPGSFTVVMGPDIGQNPDHAPYRCVLYGWLEDSARWSYVGGMTDFDRVLTRSGGHLDGRIAPSIHDKKYDRFRLLVVVDSYGAYDAMEMNELVLNE